MVVSLLFFQIVLPLRFLTLIMKEFKMFSSGVIVLGLCVFLTACKSDESEDPLAKGLVAHYSFKGGIAKDLSGNNNDGAVTGAEAEDDRSDRDDEALEFEENDDLVYINNPSFLDNDQGTFAAWVKFDNLNHTQYLASVGDEATTNHYMSFIRIDGTDQTIGVYWRQGEEANWLKSTVTVTTGVYYHMVLVSDGSEFKIYLDGEALDLNVVQGENNGNWISDIADLDNFVIGNSVLMPPYTIPYLSGKLDEVRLYDRVLSEDEILKLYDTTK